MKIVDRLTDDNNDFEKTLAALGTCFILWVICLMGVFVAAEHTQNYIISIVGVLSTLIALLFGINAWSATNRKKITQPNEK